ncbi:MAG: adenylosuccinate lyase, partial [Chloroflexi bacterium]|nr:adenylosuccinate lyase [Chloroflexota bacterium]
MIPRYTLPEMGAVWTDEAKADAWKEVEIAACEGWGELGVIPKEDVAKIQKGTYSLERMREIERVSDHDMGAFVRAFGESLGPESRFVHMGLTSSDVVDTGLAQQLVRASDILLEKVRRLTEVLERQALRYKDTPQMGRTHGVHAEPITFGFKLLLWVEEMRRNVARLEEARRQIAVGKISGAVGTHANVPPQVEEYVCRKLGLEVERVSSQIVQRDRHAHFVCALAIVGASLDKFATEIRHLQRTEVLEAEEPFEEGRQGSSSMPHKRNPARCERVSGLSRVLRGYAATALENVALWHERDISHSSAERIILPDACIALDYILHLFTGVMEHLRVMPENMLRNLELSQGLHFSQRVLLALIEEGMNRTEAYKVVQQHAMTAWTTPHPQPLSHKGRGEFYRLLAGDPAVREHLSEAELDALFDLGYHLKYVELAFQRVGLVAPHPPTPSPTRGEGELPHPPAPSPTRGEGETDQWEVPVHLRERMKEVARQFR